MKDPIIHMSRFSSLIVTVSVLTGAVWAANVPKEESLGKKEISVTPDKSLAGDLTRKKEETKQSPSLRYDKFRSGVELQVASKRREQIAALQKIINLSPDPKDQAGLLFRLGELYWEESKYFFFEANRQDDDLAAALKANDKAAEAKARSQKLELIAKHKEYGKLALEQYSEIVQKHKDYERTDEVLYFLGHNLMELGEDRKALVAFKRLIAKYPKSKYIPDAHLAFGEYYFNNSKGKRDLVVRALESYKQAASFPDNKVYGFALYKEGWCYFNLGDYQKSMDMFKTVVLYGEYAGANAVGGGGKTSLVKEARTDFVRAYARFGSPTDARLEFGKVASNVEDRFLMMKQLANLYYEDGKDKEAALTFNSLIKERPLSPEAPGFQGKIVDCVLRAGNKKMTVEQVRRLVKIMQEVERSGVIKDEKDKKSLESAKELSERTLSNLAVTWHNEAKKTRDDQTFFYANEVYADYLELFSDNPKAYDLRFFWAELLNDNLQKYERAAEEYTRVLLADIKRLDAKPTPGKAGRWLANAAYNAILAYDQVVKKAEESGQVKSESNSDPTKKLVIPPQKKSLLLACERYLKYLPKGDKRVEIAYKAANIYYRYNYLDEAVLRFSGIALGYPEYRFENGDRAGELAANLVLDSYNLVQDWAKVHEWAKRFYNSPKLATGKFKEELSKVIEQSAFKLVNQLEAKKEFAKAAESYLSFVGEFPKSEIADTALYNASADFFQAKMLDRAIQTRRHVIEKYPRSKYVPACIFANGEGFEAVGDFEESAKTYESYVLGYEKSREESGSSNSDRKAARSKAVSKKSKKAPPQVATKDGKLTNAQIWEEPKAQIALFNAGVFRDGMGQYKVALKDREHYLELWPDSKDAEGIFLSISDLYEKMELYNKAMMQLEEYERRYIRDPNKVLVAEGRIATLFDVKLHRARDVQRIQARIMEYYEKLPSHFKKTLSPEALDAVARAQYLTSENDYLRYAAIRLRWGKLPNPEVEFKAGLREKARGLESVQKLYTQTVSFKSGNPAICALHKIGLAYDNFAQVLLDAPMPKGAPADLQDAIRDELTAQALPVKDKASEAFTAALQKSQELDLYNDCSRQSLEKLRTSYHPEKYPAILEQVADLKAAKPEVRGNDLLIGIGTGTASAPTSGAKSSEKAMSDRPSSDLKDLDQQLHQAPADRKVPSGPAKPSDEPEDLL